MGRKIDPAKRTEFIRAVEENNNKLTAGGIARLLGRHPQEIVRMLTSLEDEPEKVMYEDDDGFLGRFKFW